LEENGIPALAIKGPVLSQMIHGDVTQRQYSDLDILIDPDNLYRAVELLCANGFIPEQPIKFLKNQMLLKTAKDFVVFNEKQSVHIEIHWRLFDGRLFKKSNIAIFRDSPYACIIQGNSICTLDKEVQVLYLLLHGSKHMWERIEWVADIDRLVRNDETINWEQILRWAEVMEILPMVYLGIMVCNQMFQTPFRSHVRDAADQYPNMIKGANALVDEIFNDAIHNSGEYMINYYYLGIENSKPLFSEILSRLYKPSAREIYHVNLPKSLFFLYYVILFVKVLYIQIGLFFGRIMNAITKKKATQ
jgi:hypothetical protein